MNYREDISHDDSLALSGAGAPGCCVGGSAAIPGETPAPEADTQVDSDQADSTTDFMPIDIAEK